MSPKLALLSLLLALVLFATACGSDDGTDVETTADATTQSQPADSDSDPDTAAPGDPIPVEPDGGIGDGAEPLPGADQEPADQGTWHGTEVAVTNCPGMEWTRVQASEFSFSVPADYIEQDVQPIDSEVRIWNGGNNIEVSYDYGWYSGSIANTPGAENEAVDFSGIAGERSVVRDGDNKMVGILFPEVKELDGQWDRLGMLIRFDDPNDEIIGRCIVRSIEWG